MEPSFHGKLKSDLIREISGVIRLLLSYGFIEKKRTCDRLGSKAC